MEKDDFLRRVIKVVDIGYITTIYFMIGYVLSIWIDTYVYEPFDEAKAETKSTQRLLVESIGILWVSGVIIYVIRNIVEQIPFPLDHFFGYNHLKVKELGNASVLVFVFYTYQKSLKDRLKYIFKRHITHNKK